MTTRDNALRLFLPLGALLCGLLGAAANGADDTSPAGSLTEIIVTAQKRSQNIQDVPITVAAFSARAIQDAGVTNVKNLASITPGVTVTSSNSENSTTARIRGIGTVGDNPGLESSVGTVIDGVYRPRSGIALGNLGEIEQIEVLEGPQGTLFGANNDAGVINVVSKRPSREFGVTAEATVGNYNDREVSGSVTGPVGAISAVRLYAEFQRRNGFLNVDTGLGPNTDDETNNRHAYTVRGQYLVTPSDNLDFLVIADLSKRNESCCGAVPFVSGPLQGVVNALASIPVLGGQPGAVGVSTSTPLTPYDRLAYLNQPIVQQIRDMGISGELNWNLDFAKLTSITAWRDNTFDAGNDLDDTGLDILVAPTGEGNATDFKQFSEELRFGGQDGPLNWLVGGFFSSEILTSNVNDVAGGAFDLYLGGISSAAGGANPPNFLLIPGLTGNAPGATFAAGSAGEADAFRQTSKSYALFTNETYRLTQALELTAGLRFTSETKDFTANYVDPDGGAGCGALLKSPGVAALNPAGNEYQLLLGTGCATLFNPFFANLTDRQSLKENNLSGTVKLSYHFNEEVMAYLSYANGFKAGGYNLARVTNPTAPNPLAPVLDTAFPRETVDSYEVGIKTTLANGTLRLNGSIFDQKYHDFQLNTFTGIQFIVTSLPDVSSKGVDVDFNWSTPVKGLSLAGGVTYAFTNIDEFGAAQSLFATDRLNNRLSFAPLWSGVVSATYEVPLSSRLSFRTTVSEKYSSSYNTGSDLDPLKQQASYGLLDARIGLGAPDGKWALELWSHNLANKDYLQTAFNAPLQLGQVDAFLGDPRTFGLTVRTTF